MAADGPRDQQRCQHQMRRRDVEHARVPGVPPPRAQDALLAAGPLSQQGAPRRQGFPGVPKENVFPNPSLQLHGANEDLKRPQPYVALQSAAAFEHELLFGPDADIVQVWSDYVRWSAEHAPTDKVKVLMRACKNLAEIPACKNDIRHLRLWVRYANTQSNPEQVYELVEHLGIGLSHALYYEVRAKELETRRKFSAAEEMFRRGIVCKAQPLAFLQERGIAFQRRMAVRKKRAEHHFGQSDHQAERLARSQPVVARAQKSPETQHAVGNQVEYLSRSTCEWIPAQVEGFDAESGTYCLDVQIKAEPGRVRAMRRAQLLPQPPESSVGTAPMGQAGPCTMFTADENHVPRAQLHAPLIGATLQGQQTSGSGPGVCSLSKVEVGVTGWLGAVPISMATTARDANADHRAREEVPRWLPRQEAPSFVFEQERPTVRKRPASIDDGQSPEEHQQRRCLSQKRPAPCLQNESAEAGGIFTDKRIPAEDVVEPPAKRQCPGWRPGWRPFRVWNALAGGSGALDGSLPEPHLDKLDMGRPVIEKALLEAEKQRAALELGLAAIGEAMMEERVPSETCAFNASGAASDPKTPEQHGGWLSIFGR